ncbi:Gfo/Idh/MocA family protein [Natrinema marinum]|uniref:Gfo/Idh/MocA family protein n=1 Tax=Natrinema marinum TaxID=2961598 RepID=UPI0020C90C75|nr:Gfo/Idh/MocA family oxidoreductase [Natrinema marinum]
MQPERPLEVGVVGVGSMGENHARVYEGLPGADLIGVFDVDEDRATAVADEYGASPMALDDLLASVDAVSVVVPTAHHYDVATKCLDAGVATLIEKPVVEDLETGRKLRAKAHDADVPVQVGHIERFNPAVETLSELISDLSIVSLSAERLGPPPGREIEDSAVLDLMIHDIDVVRSLLGEEPTAIQSSGVADNRHATTLLEFGTGTMASLTASRLTQRKVRRLEVTAEECLVELDYIDQSIEIHRQSVPQYVETNGDIRFRHESLVERPRVPTGEPLRNELAAFLDAAASNGTPRVTLEDGLAALDIARRIERQGSRDRVAADAEAAND